MKRSFPQVTIAATSTIAPAFNTTFNGSVTASSAGSVNVTVTSSAGFNLSDVVSLSIGTVRQEFARVLKVPDSTHITVQQMAGLNLGPGLAAHTSGDFIAVYLPIRSIYLQRVAADLNIMYVGDSTLNSGASPPLGIYASLLGVAAAVQPTEFSDSTETSHRLELSSFWTYGTINTVYDISVVTD